MKQLSTFLISCFVFLISAQSSSAIYDPRTVSGNKMGVHILHPSEVETASRLVNSNGGSWGYVTVPIQPTDRSKDKWQEFMHKARNNKVIPIIRITTIPQGGTWAAGDDTDLVDFANFLNELDWPAENRYIVLFNEVNRATEWGGTVEPEKYARIVKNAYKIFKERSPDFFLLGPALDLALPSSSSSLSALSYYDRMTRHDPHIWSYFDGWASHSYPNPAFSASPQKTGLTSIVGYKSELSHLKLAPKPVFITETGWDQKKVAPNTIGSYWNAAWSIWSKDPNVVAVTPFLLSGGEQFSQFSLIDQDGNYTVSGQALYNLNKSGSEPRLATPQPTKKPFLSPSSLATNNPIFKAGQILQSLENIFRTFLNLPRKAMGTLANIPLSLELAQTPKQWEKGLSGRTSLSKGSGMLFVFPSAHYPVFWMKDMGFPIDIIWINDYKVVQIDHDVTHNVVTPLPTYTPSEAVNMVLETPAGWAKGNEIKIGDTLTIYD